MKTSRWDPLWGFTEEHPTSQWCYEDSLSSHVVGCLAQGLLLVSHCKTQAIQIVRSFHTSSHIGACAHQTFHTFLSLIFLTVPAPDYKPHAMRTFVCCLTPRNGAWHTAFYPITSIDWLNELYIHQERHYCNSVILLLQWWSHVSVQKLLLFYHMHYPFCRASTTPLSFLGASQSP